MGGREGGKEGGREGGKEGRGREGGKEGRERKGGREEGKREREGDSEVHHAVQCSADTFSSASHAGSLNMAHVCHKPVVFTVTTFFWGVQQGQEGREVMDSTAAQVVVWCSVLLGAAHQYGGSPCSS